MCNLSLMLKKYILQIDLADSCFEVTRQFPLEVEVEVNDEVLLPGTISLSICTISRLCSKVENLIRCRLLEEAASCCFLAVALKC